MLKILKDAKPVLKREEWTTHIQRYEKLKHHLSSNRHKSPPSTTAMMLPLLSQTRSNGFDLRPKGMHSQPSNRYDDED